MYIRSRLLMLVLAWMLPSLVALMAVMHFAERSEQAANERALRDTARAMALVVEREIASRQAVARVLATSRSMSRLPQFDAADALWLREQATRAMVGMEGWVEVRSEGGLLVDTRNGTLRPSDDVPPGLLEWRDEGFVSPLLTVPPRSRALVVEPVVFDGRTRAHLGVALLPEELQHHLAVQRLPEGWVATVMDSQQKVVARQPGGATMIGRPATMDLRERVEREREGPFELRSLDGHEVIGYFSTSPSGWTYVTAMPRDQAAGFLRGAAAQLALGAAALMLLAVAAAMWVSRGIARSLDALGHMARDLRAGQPVEPRSTGVIECDDVAATLVTASGEMRRAQDELARRVDEAVQRTREAEQQASHHQRVAALGRLTGGVAHDFNNLLGVVSNSAHLLQRHAQDQPALAAPVAAILRAVDVGSRLTQQLTRFAGRRALRPQPLSLPRYVSDLQELLEQVAGKRIAVRIEVAPDTHTVIVDSSELELALINLALNARDSMPQGGTLSVRARNAQGEELSGLPAQSYVAIDIADTGSGMDAELAARVFEPFFTTKPLGEGTGLGLSQVHGFCVQAGGATRIRSTAGQGTTVSLILPAARGEQAPAPAERPRGPATDALGGVRVMVVEDNDALGEATAALLRSFGADVARVRDAGGALDALERGDEVDVVLSDVLMPGPMDGVGLAGALKSRRPPIPVVLTSGYTPQSELLQGFPFLQKPVSDTRLVELLRVVAGRGPL